MAALGKVGLALVLIVVAVNAQDKCRTGCQGVTPSVFKFSEGSTYKYSYDGYIDISLSSVEGQSRTRVTATVHLTQQSDCNQVLRVQNLQVVSGESKKHSNVPDIEKPIVLNFHDGHIEDVICTQPSDTQNSLNIKRAIASMFQATKHNGNEIDVFGSCPTEIVKKTQGQFQIIKKTRNLNKCAHRESLLQDFMSSVTDPNSGIKSSPFLQGRYTAELKLKGGIPQLITVEEDYLYVPFSNENKGAKGNVQSQLKFTGVTKENPKVSCNVPRTILFEDPHPITSDKNNVAGIILNAVKEAANDISTNVKENSASRFSSIVKLIRAASKEDLGSVYAQVRNGAGFKNKDVGKRVFIDALLRASTGQAIEVAADIYKAKGFDCIESNVFFLSLNFVQHVTEGALNAVAGLLTPDLPTTAYLGIGGLANKYCRQHSCDNVKGLNTLLKAFESNLKSRCANKQEESTVLATLKGIRNSNHITKSLTGKIIEIAQDKQAATRLRIAALETYKSDACNDRFRDSAISLLKDTQHDSEIRIKAYLALVECPNGKVATAIKNVIDNEPSIQVGGFIVSHLATLRSSANPDKALAKAQLGEIRTAKKYPVDFRQYSFNGEYSHDISWLGTAASVEGNVIYSQKSFLPRSLSFNLTTEVFGHRYNVLELDARQENYDAFLTAYFGPNGYFRNKEYVDIIPGLNRAKREVNRNNLEAFAKQITDKQSQLNKDLDLDISVKLFGSEIGLLSQNGDIENSSPKDIIGRFAGIFASNDNYKNIERKITSNVPFLNGRVSYPTSIGFPLRLNLEGTATSHFELASRIDDAGFKITLIPSVNVEVAARFVVDAGFVESGLSVVGNLYSSIGGVIEAERTEHGLEFKFGLPLEKQELVTVTHNILFETRELCGPEIKTPLKFVQNRDFSVCLDQLKSALGLTLCAVINQPNIGETSTKALPFPLNGNSKFSVYILKNNFGQLQFLQNTHLGKFNGSLSILDPGDKQISSLNYDLDLSSYFVEVDLHSPDINGKINLGLVITTHDYYAIALLAFNGLEYYVKLGASATGQGDRLIFQPIMEYKTGTGEAQKFPYHISGQIVLERSKNLKIILDNIKLIIPERTPIGISGNLGIESPEFFTDLTLNDGEYSGNLKAKLVNQDTKLDINAQFTNTWNPDFNIDLKGALEGKELSDLKIKLELIQGLANKLKLEAKLNANDFELRLDHNNNKAEIELKRETNGYKSKIEYKIGFNGKYIQVKGDVKHLLDLHRGDLEHDLVIKISSKPDIKWKSELQYTQSDIDTSLKIQCGQDVIIDTLLKAHKNGNANGYLKLNIPGHLTANGKVKGNKGAGNGDLVVTLANKKPVLKSEVAFVIGEKIPFVFDVNVKNTLEIQGKNSVFNIKIFNKGEDITSMDAGVEGELILPTEQYFAGKGHIIYTNGNERSFQEYIVLEQRANKNAPGKTLTFKSNGKIGKSWETAYTLALDDGAGYTLNGEVNLKNSKNNNNNHIEYNGKLYGSPLSETLQGNIVANCNEDKIDYKISGSYGKGATVDVKGKEDIGLFESDKHGEVQLYVDILTPYSAIQKITYKFELELPRTKPDNVQLTGSTALFVDDDGKEEGASLDVKYDFVWDYGNTEGHSKDEVSIQNHDPITLIVNYKDEAKEFAGDVTLKYKKDQEVRISGGVNLLKADTVLINLQLETPLDKAKKVVLHNEITTRNEEFKVDGSLLVNDEKYIGKLLLESKDNRPVTSVELTYPTGKIDKFYGKLSRLDENGLAFENKIVLHLYDFTLDDNIDINIKGPEDFAIKLYIDSPRLKADKVSITANTKDVHGANQVAVNVKQAGINVVDGTMTYKLLEEGNKITIDGTGQLTVNKDKKSGNFKILYRNLNAKQNGEEGVELQINSVIGNKAFDIEYIATENHFKYLTSYCVEKKECAHVEIEYKDQEDTEVLEANIDLRPLDISHEFGLKAEQSQNKTLLDIHLLTNQLKYQYNSLIEWDKAHFTLTTPNRIVSLEESASFSKDRVKGEVIFYFNKKTKPQEKTLLEFDTVSKQGAYKVDVKLSAPPLKKPLTVSYHQNFDKYAYDAKLILDIIPNSNKKIIVSTDTSVSIKGTVTSGKEHNVLDLQPLHYKLTTLTTYTSDYEKKSYEFDYSLTSDYNGKPISSSAIVKANPDKGYSKLVIHNKVIYEILYKTTISKGLVVVDTESSIIGSNPIVSRLEIKNANTAKLVVHRKDKQGRGLQINSGLIPGSIADFRMELHDDSKKIELLHGYIKLDEADFGKSEYAVNANEIDQHIVTPIQEFSSGAFRATNEHVKEAFQDVKEEFKNLGNYAQANQPDLKPILSYYEHELKLLREDLITDESLKQLAESIDGIVSAIAEVTINLLQSLKDTVETLISAIHVQSLNLVNMLEKDILPKLTEILTALGKTAISILQSVLDLYSALLLQISSFFEEYQAEVKKISITVYQAVQDIIVIIEKIQEKLSNTLSEQCDRITHELKSSQFVSGLKDHIKSISTSSADTAVQNVKQLTTFLKNHIPYEPVYPVIDLTESYLIKKFKNQECNDIDEIAAIIAALETATDKIIDDILASDLWNFDVPIASRILDTLPEGVLTEISVIVRILKGDIPAITQLQTFANLNPRQWVIPLRKYAIVAQGQHIFTFDNKHLTFPGKCSYLLARDVVNNIFSIVGVYVNGGLTELTFFDKYNTITLKKNGAVSVNGTATEYPVRESNVNVFRTYTNIQLHSTAGVEITCEPDLSLCLFSVSGFYHGQLRGLLGNANSEPYDDYTTTRGVITESESDFGNSYKLQTNCPAVKTIDHHTHHHAEGCTKLFPETSGFSVCYPFVDPTNFRQACDHGVAAQVPNTEEVIARAYATACHTKSAPALVPNEYLKCDKVDLYDTVNIKLPQKSADIVFAIDARAENEGVYKELVQNLGNTLLKDLSERGIKDVEYHVLAFGGQYPETYHITSNGGKMAFKGRMPNIKFGEEPEEEDFAVGYAFADYIISAIRNYLNDFILAIGDDPQSRAYLEATEYPFRQNAVRAIVAVTSKPCEKSDAFHLSLLQRLRSLATLAVPIHLNLITPLGDDCNFKVKDGKTTVSVIGFNKKGVITLADVKKKPHGNPDLLKDLNYDDFCAQFTTWAGGNVFVLDNYSAKTKKLYTAATSFNIAESLVSSEQQLECVCVPAPFFNDPLSLRSKNTCIVVSHKVKPLSNRKLQKV